MKKYIFFFVVQLLSLVQLFVTPWTVAHQAPLSSPVSLSLLRFRSIESVMLSYHLILPGCSVVRNLPANAGDVGSVFGTRRSLGEENGNSLQ